MHLRLTKDHQQVSKWLQGVPPSDAYVSVLTLGEILHGIEILAPGKRRTALESWFRDVLVPWFDQENILPVSRSIAYRWAILHARMKERGVPLTAVDGLLAATAVENDLTVATRDQNFSRLGITVFNPWNA